MHGQGPGRGRGRGRRFISAMPPFMRFDPLGQDIHGIEPVMLSVGELEAMRLVDLEDLSQEEAANRMGISRRTLWSDLHQARKKVTMALVEGRPIKISDMERVIRGGK